jgi:hypothetical protein
MLRSNMYYVYFIEPALGVASDSLTQIEHDFDIRCGFRFNLADSEQFVPVVA